jgi:uncharacterized protein with FMN-binding domain
VRRAPIVLVATAAGLIAVLSFHTAPAPTVLGAGALGSGSKSVSSGSSSTASSSPPSSGSGSGSGPGSTGSQPAGSAVSGSAGTGSATTTATGAAVSYLYGTVSVMVTASGHKITNVQIASLIEDGSFQSQSIDQYAVPLLEQQALRAQSANIQGVSGATYTSDGFIESLQSALSKLGI